MKLLRQLGIVLSIVFLGGFLNKVFGIPIPGNILGMIILLILLFSKVIKIEMIEEVSNFLLRYLAFFFIPAGVGLIASLDLLKGNWIPILAICIISTIIAMVVTGLTVQFVQRRFKI